MSFKVFKVIFWLVCLALFSIQSYNIFQQYGERATTMTTAQKTESQLYLPSVTICHKSKFIDGKGFATNFSEEQFQRLTLNKSDVFADYRGALKIWNITEIRSFVHGRCYTMNHRRPVKAMDFDSRLNISQAMRWLFAAVPIIDRIPKFDIPKMVAWSDVYFKQEVLQHYAETGKSAGEDGHCQDYPDRSQFISCARENFIQVLRRSANCWIPEYSYFIRQEELHLPYRQGRSDEANTWDVNSHMMNETLVLKGCAKPCTITSYNAYIRSTQAENVHFGLALYFYYDTAVVTMRKQVLLYNLPQMLSAAGGTLGMYLGLSLYSVLTDALNWSRFLKKH